MAGLEEKIMGLVARDKLEEAARLLGQEPGCLDADLRNEISVIRAELTRLAREHRRSLLPLTDYTQHRTRLSYALLALAAEAEAQPAAQVMTADSSVPRAAERAVFLSYNHADRDAALVVKRALAEADVPVRLDAEAMRAGADIRGFILESIRTTAATLCLVSERSLLSGWVATETLLTLSEEALSGGRRFVAGYLDDGFFDPAFRLRATAAIDRRLAEIDALATRHAASRIDTEDLNDERSRLFAVRNNLGRILARLRDSLVVDLRPSGFDAGVRTLVASLGER